MDSLTRDAAAVSNDEMSESQLLLDDVRDDGETAELCISRSLLEVAGSTFMLRIQVLYI